MNLLLQALKSVVIAPNAVKESVEKVAKDATSKRVEKNPTNGADIRIMHTGKVYPSQHFADKYDLEYTAKGGNTISNGVDLFNALDWDNYTKGGNTQPLLLGYVIPMNQPKVELFAGTRYDIDGNPINSVLEQGSVLSDETLELIAKGLGHKDWTSLIQDKKFIDLKLEDTEGVFTMADGKYFIPKAFNKGEKKGTFSTVKREKINIMLVTEYDGNQVADTQDAENYTETPVEDYSYEDTDGEEVPTNEVKTPEIENLLDVHSQFAPSEQVGTEA